MFKVLKNKLHRFNAKRELKKVAPIIEKESKNLSPKELVDFIYSDEWKRFFWIKQEYTELLSLCNVVSNLKPKVVVEIGTAQGGSLFLFTKLAAPGATIISIDLPGGDFGGGYEDFKLDFFKSFATNNQHMHLLRADSHAKETLEQVKAILNGQKIDFLFIDGDHRYDGVKADFDNYGALVQQHGIIGLHDIVASTNGCEVLKFWNELKAQYSKTVEYVNDPKQPFCGIGLVTHNDLIR